MRQRTTSTNTTPRPTAEGTTSHSPTAVPSLPPTRSATPNPPPPAAGTTMSGPTTPLAPRRRPTSPRRNPTSETATAARIPSPSLPMASAPSSSTRRRRPSAEAASAMVVEAAHSRSPIMGSKAATATDPSSKPSDMVAEGGMETSRERSADPGTVGSPSSTTRTRAMADPSMDPVGTMGRLILIARRNPPTAMGMGRLNPSPSPSPTEQRKEGSVLGAGAGTRAAVVNMGVGSEGLKGKRSAGMRTEELKGKVTPGVGIGGPRNLDMGPSPAMKRRLAMAWKRWRPAGTRGPLKRRLAMAGKRWRPAGTRSPAMVTKDMAALNMVMTPTMRKRSVTITSTTTVAIMTMSKPFPVQLSCIGVA